MRRKNEILPVAAEVQKLCNDYDAIFMIDDHVELVKEIRADGVHLGKNDMPVAEARRILGEEYIIGGTANTYEDIKKHWLAGVNYIGCGPFSYTTTKQKLSPSGFGRIMKAQITHGGDRRYSERRHSTNSANGR